VDDEQWKSLGKVADFKAGEGSSIEVLRGGECDRQVPVLLTIMIIIIITIIIITIIIIIIISTTTPSSPSQHI
jgi:hypothetical protein